MGDALINRCVSFFFVRPSRGSDRLEDLSYHAFAQRPHFVEERMRMAFYS